MSAIEPYLEFSFTIDPREPWSDLLMADLGTIEFEAFEETSQGFKGYIRTSLIQDETLEGMLITYRQDCKVKYIKTEIEPVNWNEKWEREFEPVVIDDRCIVKAPFHNIEDSDFDYTITLNPKMAFGTGHHQTTFLMLRAMLDMPMEGKSVLDMGSGTGVLAIMAALKGATPVRAIDIDDWAYENCMENCAINDTKHIIVEKGDASQLEGHSFNIILANINKNVLLADITKYVSCLPSGGYLMLSGFFEDDIYDIDSEANKNGLEKKYVDVLGKWAVIQYVKSD